MTYQKQADFWKKSFNFIPFSLIFLISDYWTFQLPYFLVMPNQYISISSETRVITTGSSPINQFRRPQRYDFITCISLDHTISTRTTWRPKQYLLSEYDARCDEIWTEWGFSLIHLINWLMLMTGMFSNSIT